MTPGNMLVTLVAKGVTADQTEKYYRARFAYREITGPSFARLEQAAADPRWQVPAPNPFIPRETAVIPPKGPLRVTEMTLLRLREEGVAPGLLEKLTPFQGVTFTDGDALLRQVNGALALPGQEQFAQRVLKESLALPTRLMDTPMAMVWYLPDWRFRQPRAEVLLNIFTEGAGSSAREAMLARLYDGALDEALNEFGYPVKEAGLAYELAATKTGFMLRLGGYSPRLLDLVDSLAPRLRSVEISQERFAAVKERAKRQLENRRFQQPYEQSRYYKELLVEQPAFAAEALLEAMAPVTLTNVQAYAKRAYRRIHVQGVVVGNLEPGPVRQALERLFRALDSAPLPAQARALETVRALPARADQMFSQRLSVENSSIEVYFQAGETNPRRRGALLIAGRRLQDSFYESARTQQQLGYIVWGGMSQIQKTLGLTLLIQSGAYPADALLERTDAFVPRFIADFKSMPDEAFEAYRAAVIQAKLERENTLAGIASRLLWSAFKNDAQWDYVSEDIRAVQALTRQDVQREIERVLAGPERRRLVLRLTGKNHAAKPPKGQAIQVPAAVRTAALPVRPSGRTPLEIGALVER
jgi:insulysin